MPDISLLRRSRRRAEFVALLARQAVSGGQTVGLLDPAMDRRGTRLEFSGQVFNAAPGTGQGNNLVPEIRRVRRSRSRHDDTLLSRSKSVHQTGGTPSRCKARSPEAGRPRTSSAASRGRYHGRNVTRKGNPPDPALVHASAHHIAMRSAPTCPSPFWGDWAPCTSKPFTKLFRHPGCRSSVVEHSLGKGEVDSSILCTCPWSGNLEPNGDLT